MTQEPLFEFWDRACLEKGHTGYSDPLVYEYDQPVRLATIGRVISRLFPQGDLTGCQVLDIGCGSGDFMALLRDRNATVTGLDISPLVIEEVRQRFSGDEQVSFQVGPIADAPLPSSVFDLVTSITVLQHVIDSDDLIRSLVALRESLKPQGRMILLELAPPRAVSAPRTSSGTPYLVERPPSLWRDVFDKAGLTVLDEPVMPQLGIALLRGLGRSIHTVRSLIGSKKSREPGPVTQTGQSNGWQQMSILRRLMRSGFGIIRRTLLTVAWPFDHIWGLPLPPARYRHYRSFVLAPTQRVP